MHGTTWGVLRRPRISRIDLPSATGIQDVFQHFENHRARIRASAMTDEKNPASAGLSYWITASGGLDVGSLLALRTLRDFELDLLTFFEGLEAIHLDCGKMREQILTPVIRRDESEPLRIVEPLHCACCHENDLSKKGPA